MPGKSVQDRIEENRKRITQLEALNRQLEAQAKERARKERTRQLITMGGVMAALGFDLAAVQELQHEAENRSKVREWLDSLVQRAKAKQATSDNQVDEQTGLSAEEAPTG